MVEEYVVHFGSQDRCHGAESTHSIVSTAGYEREVSDVPGECCSGTKRMYRKGQVTGVEKTTDNTSLVRSSDVGDRLTCPSGKSNA